METPQKPSVFGPDEIFASDTPPRREIGGGPSTSGRAARVTMVQATQQRQFDNPALVWRFGGARLQAILLQRSVRAMPVMIVDVIRQELVQVPRVEHDYVVQTLAPDGSDQALDKGILPGRTRGDELLFQTQSTGATHKFHAIKAVPMPQQIAARGAEREGFGQLLCAPGS